MIPFLCRASDSPLPSLKSAAAAASPPVAPCLHNALLRVPGETDFSTPAASNAIHTFMCFFCPTAPPPHVPLNKTVPYPPSHLVVTPAVCSSIFFYFGEVCFVGPRSFPRAPDIILPAVLQRRYFKSRLFFAPWFRFERPLSMGSFLAGTIRLLEIFFVLGFAELYLWECLWTRPFRWPAR